MSLLKKAASFLCAAGLLFSLAMLGGCVFDLGEFEDEEKYFESFGAVSLTGLSGTETYDLEDDFYNPAALEHFESHTPVDEYSTFVLPAKRQMDIDEIRLCVNASTDTELTVRMYVVNAVSDIFEVLVGGKSATDISLPECIAQTTVSCTAGEWDYFSFLAFSGVDGTASDTVTVSDGDSIVFLFVNNTPWGNALALEKCAFRLTALLVRTE